MSETDLQKKTPDGGEPAAEGGKKEKEDMPLATLSEVFSFAETFKLKLYIVLGLFSAMIAGFALPASVYYFSTIMGKISAIQQEGLAPVLKIIYAFLILGVIALIAETFQSKYDI